MKSTQWVYLAASVLVAAVTAAGAAETNVYPLIPWPKAFQTQEGNLEMKPTAKIAVASKDLLTLGDMLAEDIFRISGIRLAVIQGDAAAGDIRLALDPSLAGEGKHYGHTVKAGGTVEIRGADYAGVVHGTASLLQLLKWDGKLLTVPKFSLADHSVAPYVGMMLDVARNYNSLEVIKDCVTLCRLYKIRYFHLHLADDHSWTFPSRAFPRLGTANRPFWDAVCEVYPREGLMELVRFAEQRGVTLVPEFEGACHTDSLRAPYPETFDANDGGAHLGIVDMSNPNAYKGFATLFAEAADIFATSPYIHFGNDEPWALDNLGSSPSYKGFMEKHGFKSNHELWAYWIAESRNSVQALGKKMIVWQDAPLTKGVVVMQWHINGDHGGAEQVAAQGYEVIQVTWTPGVLNSVEEVYGWSPYSEKFPPGGKNLGSEMVLWEMPGRGAIPALRWKAPPRNERTYGGPEIKRTYQDFVARLRETDRLLDILLTGLRVTEIGTDPTAGWLANKGAGASLYGEPFQIALEAPGAAEIHYTFDGSNPTPDSPKYEKPIEMGETPAGWNRLRFNARAFGRSRDAFWGMISREYTWNPLRVKVEGTTVPDGNQFAPQGATVTVEKLAKGGSVRYVLKDDVKPDSPVVQGPIVITNACRLTLCYFGDDNKARGLTWQREFSPAPAPNK